MRGGMSETNDEKLNFYPMANLRPAMTGLPMVVWVSERGLARDDVRVKVSAIHGSRVHGDMAAVAMRPAPRLIAGHLSASDLQVVPAQRVGAGSISGFTDRHCRTGPTLAAALAGGAAMRQPLTGG
jgi:hypothetical protein